MFGVSSFFRNFAAMKTAVDIFTRLGERLAAFGADEVSKKAIEQAQHENGWFTPDDMKYSVEAIREEMLDAGKLQTWLSRYDCSRSRHADVAIIMAGNIPLVGFYDLLCVIAAGHKARVKPSNKDRVLMTYIIELLRDIEPEIPVFDYDRGHVDAVIATGSDNANRYFKAEYAGIPSLLRGNRHSVAVLSGHETAKQIEGLKSDIFRYSGLGCRNVSLIFVPRGYDFRLPEAEASAKYRNNYLQNRAVLTMTGRTFEDHGSCVTVESDEFPTALSQINIVRYDNIGEVEEWLHRHDDELQCVVSETIGHSRRVDFGRAQRPCLDDCPDDKDVMEFLLNL